MRNSTYSAFALVLFVGCGSSRTDSSSIDASASPAIVGATSRAAAVDARALVSSLRAHFAGVIASPATGFTRVGGDLSPTIPRVHAPGVVDRAPVDVRLPSVSGASMSLRQHDVELNVRLTSAQAIAAQVGDGAVVYQGAVYGGTLVSIPYADGVEEYVHFESKPSVNELRYELSTSGIAGLRLVEGALELLDATGNPLFHTMHPWVSDGHGKSIAGTIAIEGCAYDHDVRAPWGRKVTAPGADRCTIVMGWSDEGLSYPILVDPLWASAGTMKQKRVDHCAAWTSTPSTPGCTAPLGCVVVTGGQILDGTALNNVELYNVATRTWASIADMPAPGARSVHTCVSNSTTAGDVMIMGGYQSSGALTAATAVYDVVGAKWVSFSPLPGGARAYMSAVAIDPGTIEVVVTGGTTASGASGAVDYFTNKDQTWFSGAPLVTPRYLHASSSWKDGSGYHLVVLGGAVNIGSAQTASVEVADVAALASASAFNTMPTGLSLDRYGVLATLFGTHVLVGGGERTTAAVGDPCFTALDVFDTATRTTRAGTSSSNPTSGGGPALVGVGAAQRVLFAGGSTIAYATTPACETTYPTGELYSAIGARIGSTPLPTARSNGTVTTLGDGTVLVAGGSNPYTTRSGACPGTPTLVDPILYAPYANATACSADTDCMSLHCADGVCCDTACTGTCQACNVAGKVGTCSPSPKGSPAAHGACSKSPTGGICGYECDGVTTADCAAAPSGTLFSPATCSGVNSTPASTCTGSGTNTTATTAVCPSHYACNSGGTACNTACASNGDCAPGYKCSGTSCIPAGTAGSPCTAPTDCAGSLACVDAVCCSSTCTGGAKCNIPGYEGGCHLPFGTACTASTASLCAGGNCVDGVCCDSACTGQCQACDASPAGHCAQVIGGQPHGSRSKCAGAGSACEALCDGSSPATCGAPKPTTQVCIAPSCSGGSATPASYCNGTGACAAASPSSCGAYVCGPTACKSGGCATGADCATGYHCAGTCVTNGTLGTKCGGDGECASGHCADGVCCTVASCASPQVCSANGAGTCSKPLAATCAADGDCGSGHCVDGVCCDKACAGQCEACDVSGSTGTCTQVLVGAPHGSRAACSGTGKCQSTCDGSSRVSCGALPGTDRACASASCTGATYTPTSFCDGLGACAAATSTSCFKYTCGGSSCKSSCTKATSTTDCASGYTCADDGTCKSTGALGTLCAGDSDCTSGHCVDAGAGNKVCCSAGSCPTGDVCAPSSAASPGACVAPLGGKCDSTSSCATGFCVDGVCCDGPCTNQCEACDVPGAVGKCTGVSGPTHGTRDKCSDGGGEICKALSCDGSKDRTKCAVYANGLDKQCAPASCKDGNATTASTCDGAGACKPGTTASCVAYACGGTTCKTTCAVNDDCASGYGCDSTKSQCTPLHPTCSGDGQSSIAPDKLTTKPCAPYKCDPSTNNCFETCTTAADCAPGLSCDGTHCVAPSGDTGGSGGCAMGAPSGDGALLGISAILGVLAAVGARRRRTSTR